MPKVMGKSSDTAANDPILYAQCVMSIKMYLTNLHLIFKDYSSKKYVLTSRKLQKIQKIKKVKVRQYNCTYLKFGFTTAVHDATRPMCLVCGSIFSNEASEQNRQ